MDQAVRKAFAADAGSYDRARRKLVPCFDDFYRTALELLPFGADDYYNRSRTHLSLDKDCPDPRPVMPPRIGRVIAFPQVSGLHHRYERLAA
jgi:hypothetical protein